MKLIEKSKLLDCHFKNGMMMLPYYHSIIEARENKQTFAGEGSPKAPLKKRFKSLIQGLWHCKAPQKNVLIFSSTLFNVMKNGRYFNSLHGYYYNLYPNDTLLIEDSDISFMWRTSDSFENLSFINTYIVLLSVILQKIMHPFRTKHYKNYNIFVETYPNLFTVDQLSKDDDFTRYYAFFIKRLLKRVQPKVILVNCGSFGHNAAIVCYVAKKMGIKVIEPQHGVTYECPGYVASDIIASSKEYYNYLPDALFTFGNYWNSFVTWDYEKVPVGNPYLNEYISNMDKQELTDDILVISQPMNEEEEEKKREFVKSLSKTFPNLRILFRIHPSENYMQQKNIYKECSNIVFSDLKNGLYDDICRCRNVLGWFSTCLFECLAFKRVPIIVDTEFTRMSFPNNLGVWVKTADDIKKLNLDAVNESINYTDYWKTDFENNALNYLDVFINKSENECES